MGMAASQARYLELTARKTNVEYEGQQINQQRTALANESSGMFTRLMSLQVPTPPSTTDYTKIQYTFNDGQNTNTITDVKSLTGDPDYNSMVSYYYNQSVYTGVGKTRTDLGVRLVGTAPDTAYWLTNGAKGGSATNQTQLTQCSATGNDAAADKKAIEQIISSTGSNTNFAKDYNKTDGIENIYKYTSTNGVTNYYCATDLDIARGYDPGPPPIQNTNNGAAQTFTGYYASNIDQKQNVTEKAYVTQDSSGRYSTIQLESEGKTTLNITTTSTTDQNAYNDAMNKYTYNQQMYQQEVNSINAKTEVIQNEDRTLELELKQLDTEQKALTDEMEAVKKVIEKNVEMTFKTFAS